MKVVRIDYLSTKGKVVDSVEFTDADAMLKEVREENYYGTPMSIVVYSDGVKPLVPVSAFSDMDPPPCGFRVE